MTIAIGQVGFGALNDNTSNYTVTTTGVNTSASGSAFALVLCTKEPVTNRPKTITDSFGNTYTQIGSDINNAQALTMYRYYCANGVGGTGHTATSTATVYASGTATGGTTTTLVDTSQSWTTNQWTNYDLFIGTQLTNVTVTSNTATTLTFGAIGTAPSAGNSYILGAMKQTLVLVELTGAATSSLLDQSNTNAGFLSSPQSPGGITLSAVPSSGEMMLSTFLVNGGGNTLAESTGFTSLYNNTGSGFPSNINMQVAYKLATTNGTYTPSWSGAGTTFVALSVDSFFGGSGVSGPVVPLLYNRKNVLYFI